MMKGCLGGFFLLAPLAWYCLVPAEQSETPSLSGNVTSYGEVARQGAYEWTQGMTVRGLISRAGGTTPFAKTSKVKVVVPPSKAPPTLKEKARAWLVTVVNTTHEYADSAWDACHLPGTCPKFRMEKMLNLKATVDLRKPTSDFALTPGDVVIVEERLVTF
jgi:protein involved in polysaccharide export with SLBB domain